MAKHLFQRRSKLNFLQSIRVDNFFRGLLIGLLTICSTAAIGAETVYSEDVLILYDASGEHGHVGRTHCEMLANLLGHFDVNVLHKPVSTYKSGDMGDARATFYIGAVFNEANNFAPESEQALSYHDFLQDASQAATPLVWFNYNIWWLNDFLQKKGLTLSDVFGFIAKGVQNNGYNRVTYKETELFKGVVPHANPGANLLGCIEEGEGRWACSTELVAIEVIDPDMVEVYAETYSTLQPDVQKNALYLKVR